MFWLILLFSSALLSLLDFYMRFDRKVFFSSRYYIFKLIIKQGYEQESSYVGEEKMKFCLLH